MDVLCAHPYARDRQGLEGMIRSYESLRQKHGKPLLVNECIPGCLDDAKRAECRPLLHRIARCRRLRLDGLGLCEGKAISTRRDRYDGNGIDGQGFHPFFTKDGQLRPGLDFLTETPTKLPPWQTGAAS